MTGKVSRVSVRIVSRGPIGVRTKLPIRQDHGRQLILAHITMRVFPVPGWKFSVGNGDRRDQQIAKLDHAYLGGRCPRSYGLTLQVPNGTTLYNIACFCSLGHYI